uniref:Ig-like domain-containing protein n=1 Tax=Amphilophus citrinellus TaxID=61819 RepID=A0A3Q0SKR0_AMPCI
GAEELLCSLCCSFSPRENHVTAFHLDDDRDAVTLSCKYSGLVQALFWYQQKSSSPPQFLIADYSEKTERLTFKKDQENSEFHLEISSAAVTDSAVYYCALSSLQVGCEAQMFGGSLK